MLGYVTVHSAFCMLLQVFCIFENGLLPALVKDVRLRFLGGVLADTGLGMRTSVVDMVAEIRRKTACQVWVGHSKQHIN